MKAQGVFQPSDAERLYADLRAANSEQAKKERFLQYLTTTFSTDAAAQKLISAIALGAERTIANIPRGSRLASGRADTQTETVIIEWERDLNRTGEHAREQLEEYLAGNWHSGQTYRFILLATDGVRWRRYAPDWSNVDLDAPTFGQNFKLREVQRFDLSPDRFGEFPFFLDQVLFASQPRAATLESIQSDFGDTSSAFINSMAALQLCAAEIKEQTELRVAFQQWRRFLSIAYGRFDDSPTMFLVHTYLSVFAKFIAYAVLTKEPISDDATLHGVLTGSVFQKLNIERFVEDDFFHWVATPDYFGRLRPMFRELSRQIQEYDFHDVRQDILKGVYQELIDLETRHALGEYYTPDWLCERLIEELSISSDSNFLDPACGSGSFLRAIIARLRSEYPSLTAGDLTEQVVGIDIHPLSVLIAKTTVLLALGAKVSDARQPVTLHIYLANSLLVPRGTADLFESTFKVSVDNKSYTLDVRDIDGAEDFDQLVTACDELVERYEEGLTRDHFLRLIKSALPKDSGSDLPGQLYDVYKGMKAAHMQGRDSIWKFILQNSYKPVFLMNRFDFVVGNPPWLTYASVSNGEYQNLLRQLSDGYGVTPFSRANMPHLEIAAIFLAHSANYFLKPSGQVAFVLPRSFMSADQHDNTRGGGVEGLRLLKAWDLEGIVPLFRVPACVLFASRGEDDSTARRIPTTGIPGYQISGRLPRSQIHWDEIKDLVEMTSCRWYYSRLQGGRGPARSALTTTSMEALTGSNAYASKFTQGATIVPRNFFFVDVDQALSNDEDVRDRVIALRTSAAAEQEARPPWRGQILTGRAEGSLLFRTAIARNILPFALIEPRLVLLPLVTEIDAQDKETFRVLSAETLLEKGFRYASHWFFDAESRWDSDKTDTNKQQGITLSSYLNWQNKLTDQNPRARYLVLYTSSATDASAVVIDRTTFDHPFVVDHKAYRCECQTIEEAHYLSAYINSNYPNELIKEFQSRGLFGPRDIHKLIVKIPFPKFKRSDERHARLANLGRACAEGAAEFVQSANPQELSARSLGTVRSRLRTYLESQLAAIDGLVEELSTEASQAKRKRPNRARNAKAVTELFD
ncbi:N-6 DNA methylase [Methyloceanibacter sp.]|uniref:N-6 DNA methylase n=1 Tax=Methyloceanibacter sp. TaxID=1965321 RepID=UPI002B968F73|nr:N-6 DNA methylase [Methyloceanibacter sp.]HML92941.1 N-6 DNA methylase [Methyloceanibacter sp.]